MVLQDRILTNFDEIDAFYQGLLDEKQLYNKNDFFGTTPEKTNAELMTQCNSNEKLSLTLIDKDIEA